ncbi:MAG: PilZ domain-containing protein [Candidatus Aureabacteria bacterium]|nr:PilZ domain-containing protein [Candidatus Auribacterota bacterium]
MKKQEGRRFVRVPCENLLAYCVLQEGGHLDSIRADLVKCKNISEGGVLFSAMESFLNHTILKMKLRLDLDVNEKQDLTLIGEVVRCQLVPEQGKWDVGVFICCIEKAKKELFYSWLRKKLKSGEHLNFFEE